uniref:Activating transcription factor 5b n=1 Tax=Gadus morhua TaxID=8049 RepID=A0A8C5FNQ8_GADMO
ESTMSASILRKKNPAICMGALSIAPLQLAGLSQSGYRKGAELRERQNLIGDGHTDWMTEKVDLSSFVSTTTGSSPRSSLPPSPLQHDVKVPSDLEVMTSLLQEELAQLEDYFRSESSSATAKLDKSSKCDKGVPAMGTQSYYQLPYASYGAGQSDASPVVVTLATGELDLASFCSNPIGRTKIARPAPYNYHHRYHHHHHTNGRRGEPGKLGEDVGLDTWGSRGGYSGSADLSVNHYSTLKPVGKNSVVGVKKVRECALSLKEEESYCFRYEGGGGLEVLHGSRDGRLSGGPLAQETMGVAGDGYYHQAMVGAEPYHSFIGDLDQPSQASHALDSPHGHYLYPDCLPDQSYECLSRGECEAPLVGGSALHRPHSQRLKHEVCSVKPPLVLGVGLGVGVGVVPLEGGTGERKQKKRDQNKTAAHRYRLRKRAELDSLEEELHGLEGQNRELRDKAESVEREIQYVKDLLIEVYKARSQRLKQDST